MQGLRSPHLFIIDEVFKGTNTKERVAASKAMLSYLNQDNNIVMVSTHNLGSSTIVRIRKSKTIIEVVIHQDNFNSSPDDYVNDSNDKWYL